MSTEKRNFENFNEHSFVNDLNDPNYMWADWLNPLMSVIDVLAPLKTKLIKKRKFPWITSHVVQKICFRYYPKKQFDATRDTEICLWFKKARNKTNNAIRQTQHDYSSTKRS